MSKSKKFKVYNGKKIKNFYENSRIWFLLIMFSAGIIIGALNINKDNLIAEELNNVVNIFKEIRTGSVQRFSLFKLRYDRIRILFVDYLSGCIGLGVCAD